MLLGWSGLELASLNNHTSPLWIPSGLAIGSIILFGNWLAPAIFVGAFFTNLIISTPLIGTLSIATGNMLEAMVGSQIILWMLRRRYWSNYSEFLAIIVGGVVASSVSATVGVASLYFLQQVPSTQFLYSWYTWWSGNFVGTLLVLPLFLQFYLGKKADHTVRFEKAPEALAFLGLFYFVTYMVFVRGENQAFSWLLTPVFIFSGLRLGHLISRITLILVAIPVVVLTLLGQTPFDFGNLNLNMIYVQSLILSYAIAVLFVRPFSNNFKIRTKFVIGTVVGWVSVFLVIYALSASEKFYLQKDLQETIATVTEAGIETSLKYEILLTGGVALFKVKPKITPKEWDEYVQSLQLSTYYKGADGLGFIRYLTNTQAKNMPLKTINKDYAQQFPDHYVIAMLSPIANNQVAINLDIGSEKLRREAVELAHTMGKINSTNPIQLMQDDKHRPGFAVFSPVWINDQFQGLVYSPIIAETFFSQTLSPFSHLLRMNVSFGNIPIFQSHKTVEKETAIDALRIKKNVVILNKKYLIDFYPTPQFLRNHNAQTGALALLVSLFMLFISAFLLEQISYGQQAEKMVSEKSEELEFKKTQLIDSSKMASLGRMASGMAHEINNPLAIILMKIKVISVMLNELNVNNPRLMDELARVIATTHRIDNIIKGLKSFSRASSEDPFQITPLNTIVEETLELCYERLKMNQIDLQLGPIPDVAILTRPGQLAQVWVNLLNNAIDAIEPQKSKWIALNIKILNSKVQISVIDSGGGIPKEVAEKMMDHFFTTKEFGKGTGLGLSIAKGIVEDHGGSIWLDEDSPHTAFIIELPTHRSTKEGFS